MSHGLNKILKSVKDETPKTELKAETVELNMAKDIKSLSDKANKDYEKALKGVFGVLKAIDDALAYIEPAIKNADEARKLGKEYQVLAKKLGAEVPSEIDKAIQRAYEISKLEGVQTMKDLKAARKSF